MAALTWSDDLLLGVSEIDRQHLELFQKISDFNAACQKGQGHGALIETLRYFEDYVRYHFSAEERLQQKIGYPDFAMHQKLHANLLQELKDLRSQLTGSGVTQRLSIRAMEVWTGWFVRHIARDDKAIAEYMQKNGIQQAELTVIGEE
jgi:hemerythrin